MIAYFPKVYPGELLYSLLARYHRHVGAPGTMHTLDALFGSRKVTATFDLPGHLQLLVDCIPPDCALSVDHIIDTLTLFPYFTAFAPPALRQRIRGAMRSGAIDGLHVRLGLLAFRIRQTQRLRFCPECTLEMNAGRGELWWRRDHQLPGVLVCPGHGCLLRESSVSFSTISRHEFVAATAKNCSPRARLVASVPNNAYLGRLHRLAGRSAELLSNPPSGLTLSGWTMFYRSHMLDTGLAKSTSTMDPRRLDDEFRSFYGRTLSLLPDVMNGDEFTGGWLTSMVRKHRKVSHPLQHVPLQEFLAHRERRTSPFGVGPWLCINPLASHHSQPVIKIFTQHGNRGNRVGVFSCSCGYVYTRCLDSRTGALGAPRFLLYGPLLDPVLRQLVTSGKGLREVGRNLRLDPKTVVRLARELGVTVPWKLTPFGRLPQASRQTLTQPVLPSPRSSTVVPTSRKIASPTRRDWPAIDYSWTAKLSSWVETVRKETPPVRVTIAELERRANRRGWLLKRRGRLPRSMAFLRTAVESVENFQLRRIHWAVAELERSGAPVKGWQVMRKAGLHSSSLERISAALDAAPIPFHKVA